MSTNVTEIDVIEDRGSESALSWPAVIGGALAAAGVTLIFLALGAGLGFASISPWPRASTTAATFGVMTAVWFVIVQWLASAFGGYLAGRLRAKWVGIHTDESFFRDTVHGVLAWALATVCVALLSVAAATVTSTVAVSAAAASTPAEREAAPEAALPGLGYLTDTLFRSDHPTGVPADTKAEAGRILTRGLGSGTSPDAAIPDADKAYLAHLVGATIGVDQATAVKRVDDVVAEMQREEQDLRKKADAARKAASAAAFATALSLLIGAFIAGAAGALGGRHRDELPIPTASQSPFRQRE